MKKFDAEKLNLDKTAAERGKAIFAACFDRSSACVIIVQTRAGQLLLQLDQFDTLPS